MVKLKKHEISHIETNETSKRKKAFRAVQWVNNSEKVFLNNFIITGSNPNGSFLPTQEVFLV